MISIQHNMSAMNANRQFKINTGKRAKLTEKLSSGYKINRAADGAAELAMSEKMRRLVRGLNQTVNNIEDGIGYVQTAEGALNEVDDMLHRMNELMVKGANGTLQQQDRDYIDAEVQALKGELDRIFKTTSFNEKKIWEPTGARKQIGSYKAQAARIRSSYRTIDVTDENCGVIPTGSFKVKATEADGVSITWTGYNGTTYETNPIGWDTLEANNYRFEMSDYFKAENTDLFLSDGSGTPQFTHQVSLDVQESATVQDIVAAIDGGYIYNSPSVSFRPQFEGSSASAVSGAGVSISYQHLNYAAAYVSQRDGGATDGYTFDAACDSYIEPTGGTSNLIAMSGSNTTSVDAAKNSTDTWKFSFEMKGIGTVIAESTGVEYASPNSLTDDDEGTWWNWYRYGNSNQRKEYTERYTSGGTLQNVMNALTGDANDTTPGLLTEANGGASNKGGYIDICFSMKAASAFSYGASSSTTSVGSFDIRIQVSSDDTEQTVLDKINAALNSNTMLDMQTQSAGSDYFYFQNTYNRDYLIDVPIWGGINEFFVQAGTEAGQHISVQYEALSNIRLGIDGTNSKTVEDCENGINEIKKAMQMVNTQRSDFGAYQNRLEHSIRNNSNIAENTQAAESTIRDTDMSETMVEYSNQNILLQAGQAMLAQANQQSNSVLSLLQ